MNTSSEPNEAQIKRAVEQLYESEGLTDALTDEAASLLLKWGEQQLKNLAASNNYDEAGWEIAAYQLRRVVSSINSLVERHMDMSEPELIRRLTQLVEKGVDFATPKSTTHRGAINDEET